MEFAVLATKTSSNRCMGSIASAATKGSVESTPTAFLFQDISGFPEIDS
jgi:hypothetical protein